MSEMSEEKLKGDFNALMKNTGVMLDLIYKLDGRVSELESKREIEGIRSTVEFLVAKVVEFGGRLADLEEKQRPGTATEGSARG